MKKCSKCQEIKSFESFCKDRSTKDGHACYCRYCFSLIKKVNDKKYSKSEKGKLARAKALKKYMSKPDKRKNINEKRRLRKKHDNRGVDLKLAFDPVFKLKYVVRNRLNAFLKNSGLKKKYKMSQYLGCSPAYLKTYLENKFKPGMSWNNHGDWHIDHIVPLASAQTEDDIYKLCHYTNLQPLWAYDNRSKGDKILSKVG